MLIGLELAKLAHKLLYIPMIIMDLEKHVGETNKKAIECLEKAVESEKFLTDPKYVDALVSYANELAFCYSLFQIHVTLKF